MTDKNLPAPGDMVTCSRVSHPHKAHRMSPSCVRPQYSMVVDPNRIVTEDEIKALVVVETANRLAVRAHRLLEVEQVDEITRLETQCLLEEIVDLATNRMATAVKKQGVSDQVSKMARRKVTLAGDAVARRLALVKRGKRR